MINYHKLSENGNRTLLKIIHNMLNSNRKLILMIRTLNIYLN